MVQSHKFRSKVLILFFTPYVTWSLESDFRQTKHKLSETVKSSWLDFLELEWDCILKGKLKYQALVLVR